MLGMLCAPMRRIAAARPSDSLTMGPTNCPRVHKGAPWTAQATALLLRCRKNIEANYLPLPTDATYEGIVKQYYFDTSPRYCNNYMSTCLLRHTEAWPSAVTRCACHAALQCADCPTAEATLPCCAALQLSGRIPCRQRHTQHQRHCRHHHSPAPGHRTGGAGCQRHTPPLTGDGALGSPGLHCPSALHRAVLPHLLTGSDARPPTGSSQ